MEEKERVEVPIRDKFALTIKEAAGYFNIGEKKLRSIAESHKDDGFIIQNGVKLLIKRQKFEEFLNQTNSI